MAKRRRASGSKAKSLVWTTVITAEEDVSNATQNLDIVQGVDWSVVAGKETATLLTIRGNVSMARRLTNHGAVFMYIAVFDKDETSPSPVDPAVYVEEDILWTGCWEYSSTMADTFNLPIHVKAKRRISNGQEVRFVFVENSVTNSVFFSCILRALVNKANN